MDIRCRLIHHLPFIETDKNNHLIINQFAADNVVYIKDRVPKNNHNPKGKSGYLLKQICGVIIY